MWRAFRSELIKLRRRSVLLAPLAMVAFALLGSFLSMSRAQTTASSGVRPELTKDYLATITGITSLLRRDGSIALVIGMITMASTTGAEWTQGTVRNLLVRQPKRITLFLGRGLALTLYVVISGMIALAINYGSALLLAPHFGINTSDWTSTDGINSVLQFAGNQVINLAGYGIIGMLFAIITRSAASAVGVSLAYILVIEGLLNEVWHDVGQWLPGQLMGVLNTNGNSTITYSLALSLVCLYLAGMLIVSSLLFRFRDVTA